MSTLPLPSTNIQTTYDVLRGLGIVGSSAAAAIDDDGVCGRLPGHGRNSLSLLTEVGLKLNWTSKLLLFIGLRKCTFTFFPSDWRPCGSCRDGGDQCFLWDNGGRAKAFSCQLEHGSQPPGGAGEHGYSTGPLSTGITCLLSIII